MTVDRLLILSVLAGFLAVAKQRIKSRSGGDAWWRWAEISVIRFSNLLSQIYISIQNTFSISLLETLTHFLGFNRALIFKIIFNDVSADKSYFRFQNVECTRNESKKRDISCTKGILNRVDVDNSDLRRLVWIALKSCDCEPTQFARRKKSWKEDGGRYASYLLTKSRN